MSPIENIPQGLSGLVDTASGKYLSTARATARAPLPPEIPDDQLPDILRARYESLTRAQTQAESINNSIQDQLTQLSPLLSNIASELRQLGLSDQEIDQAVIASIAPASLSSPKISSPEKQPYFSGRILLNSTGFENIKHPDLLLAKLRKNGVLVEGEDYVISGKRQKYNPHAAEKLNQLHQAMEEKGTSKITTTLIKQVFPPTPTK